MQWDILVKAIIEALPIVAIMCALMGLMLAYAFWRDSKIVIRHYPFRADLIIQRGCPTVYQSLHIIIPARSLEQAKELAEQIGALHDTCPTYDPEFRYG